MLVAIETVGRLGWVFFYYFPSRSFAYSRRPHIARLLATIFFYSFNSCSELCGTCAPVTFNIVANVCLHSGLCV